MVFDHGSRDGRASNSEYFLCLRLDMFIEVMFPLILVSFGYTII